MNAMYSVTPPPHLKFLVTADGADHHEVKDDAGDAHDHLDDDQDDAVPAPEVHLRDRTPRLLLPAYIHIQFIYQSAQPCTNLNLK